MTDGNCPNCGAPIRAPVCDYCGTRHWGFEEVPGYPASKVTQMLSQGLVTVTEAREMMGLRPLSRIDEWDSCYTPKQRDGLHNFVLATAVSYKLERR